MERKVKVRKIRRMDGRGGKGHHRKSELQIQNSRVSGIKKMIGDNPMKNPEVSKKHGLKRRGRKPVNAFKPGNQVRKGMTGNPGQIMAGRLTGAKNIGRKPSRVARDKTQLRCLLNNPMKDPEVVKRRIESQRKNKIARANKARKKASLTNPNVRKGWFKKKEPLELHHEEIRKTEDGFIATQVHIIEKEVQQ